MILTRCQLFAWVQLQAPAVPNLAYSSTSWHKPTHSNTLISVSEKSQSNLHIIRTTAVTSSSLAMLIWDCCCQTPQGISGQHISMSEGKIKMYYKMTAFSFRGIYIFNWPFPLLKLKLFEKKTWQFFICCSVKKLLGFAAFNSSVWQATSVMLAIWLSSNNVWDMDRHWLLYNIWIKEGRIYPY